LGKIWPGKFFIGWFFFFQGWIFFVGWGFFFSRTPVLTVFLVGGWARLWGAKLKTKNLWWFIFFLVLFPGGARFWNLDVFFCSFLHLKLCRDPPKPIRLGFPFPQTWGPFFPKKKGGTEPGLLIFPQKPWPDFFLASKGGKGKKIFGVFVFFFSPPF